MNLRCDHRFICRWLILTLLLFLGSASTAHAQQGKRFVPVEPRVALVIGNAAYPSCPLANPPHDADDMADALKQLGFSVTKIKDADRKQMLAALHAFGAQLGKDSIALFYYSGHGAQARGVNYLIPTGFHGKQESDLDDNAVEAGKVLREMSDAGSRLNLVILDACRDNPFSKGFRSVQRGLAKMEAPAGTLIFYAASPGQTASDNPDGRNGLYTQALLKYLVEPGLEIGSVFKKVYKAVKSASHGEQVPWQEGAVGDDFYFQPGSTGGGGGSNPTPHPMPGGKVVKGNTKALLTVATNPAGATVYVNKKAMGKTPFAMPIDLDVDDTRDVVVVIKLPGYGAQKFTVTLKAGEETTIPAEGCVLPLEKLPDPMMDDKPNDDGGSKAKHKLGDVMVNDKDGAEMVYVPAGEFQMGDDDQADNPRHTVNQSGYWIYKNLVTVREYKAFCQAMGHQMPDAPTFNPDWSKANHPIVNVTWEDAKAYCDWAGVDLPSEAQWEKAARGTDGRKYPWGDNWDASKLWCSKSSLGDASGTDRVGSFPDNASPCGALDMAGNVVEWCQDWYDEDYWKQGHGPDPAGPPSGSTRCLRGGNWKYLDSEVFRAAFRSRDFPTNRSTAGGFRCARQD